MENTNKITYLWGDEAGSYLIYSNGKLIDTCDCMEEILEKYPNAVNKTPKID